MGILIAFLIALLIACIIALCFRPRPGPYRWRRLWRVPFNLNPTLSRFPNLTPGPREAMENLAREIQGTRSRARRSSHRPRPR